WHWLAQPYAGYRTPDGTGWRSRMLAIAHLMALAGAAVRWLSHYSWDAIASVRLRQFCCAE
ncbi:MAG: hypothetical protein LIP09_13380, partial [Bacteroidales bacterium]|nr:hypothetical protein [Bacteroidales bacterium]